MLGWTLALVAIVRGTFANVQYARFDLGNMVQAVWSTAHGHPLEITTTSGDQILRLGSHVDPILILLTPFWLLAPTPVTLIAVQIAVCALGALPVFWLARKHLGTERAAALLSFAYLAYPWLAWAMVEGMHPVVLAVPLLLFAMRFLDEDRLVAFAVVGVLACACGELIGVTVAALGVWYAVARHRRSGWAIAVLALGWSIVCVYVIVPRASGGSSIFYDLYASVGSSPQGVVRTAVTDPAAIAAALLTGRDAIYVLFLLLPTAGLCLLSPGLLLVALPQLLANGLSGQQTAVDPRFHHVSAIVPLLFAATIFGIAKAHGKHRESAALAVLITSLGVSFMFGPWRPAERVRWFDEAPSAVHRAAIADALALVPAGAPVSSTNRVGSYLSARREYYSAPLVRNAQWVLIDLEDTWSPIVGDGDRLGTWGEKDAGQLRLLARRLRTDPSWSLRLDRDRVVLFERTIGRSDAQATTAPRRKSTISLVVAPGPKTSATPFAFSSSASSGGIVPPTTTSTSSAPFARSPSTIRGTSVMCAPERMDTPTASASSWIAVSTICSGVWWRPV
jgi:uncharacterized membrane protein